MMRIAEDANSPVHHAKAAVCEDLHVPSKYPWVEFGSPKEIFDDVSICTRVSGGWKVKPLKSEESNKYEATKSLTMRKVLWVRGKQT
jgi:hypothetical protein